MHRILKCYKPKAVNVKKVMKKDAQHHGFEYQNIKILTQAVSISILSPPTETVPPSAPGLPEYRTRSYNNVFISFFINYYLRVNTIYAINHRCSEIILILDTLE